MEVFELRMEIDTAQNFENDLLPLQMDIQTRFDDGIGEVAELFEHKDRHPEIDEVLQRVNYWNKIL